MFPCYTCIYSSYFQDQTAYPAKADLHIHVSGKSDLICPSGPPAPPLASITSLLAEEKAILWAPPPLPPPTLICWTETH